MNPHYLWTVIGAGPAGIAAVGKLLDHGIPEKQILWIDPLFRVGDFGTRWRNVSSNTKAGLFTKFLLECHAFDYQEQQKNFSLHTQDPHVTCELHHMATPLQWVSDHLKKRVTCVEALAEKLQIHQHYWEITTPTKKYFSKHIVLAVGADPKSLSHPSVEEIALENVLDRKRISAVCSKDDKVAVFGSSHSGIMAVRHLLEHPVQQVINFYRSPLCYAVFFDDWILFDNTGLKGQTANWARQAIDGEQPKHLRRYFSSDENIQQYLPECNKVVYAIGFEKRCLPVIEGIGLVSYNDKNGIIAPGLFGFGIAYPESKTDRLGNVEYSVGLWKFMDYINRVLPVWMRYSI
ncbi:pyridine nucleotide-disulfide oxidoreductase [Gammaproteobacteria bacterium SCGC AG-212-F23]|nr:pyridine nucleotide-disulfide oxidoreductase [Gammaproteobacteria bacterium SCGC AG-212-F23]